jgi:hypothetical protein
VSHLFGIILQLLMPVSWNVSSGSLQLYASHAVFLTFLTIMLELLKLHTLQVRRLHLEALFLLVFFSGYKFCPPLVHNICLRVLNCSIKNFTQLSVACKYCTFARYATAANLVCSNIDVFRRPVRSLHQVLPWKHVSFVLHFSYLANLF